MSVKKLKLRNGCNIENIGVWPGDEAKMSGLLIIKPHSNIIIVFVQSLDYSLEYTHSITVLLKIQPF